MASENSSTEDTLLRIGVAGWIGLQVFMIPLNPRTRFARIKWWCWYFRGYNAERSGETAFQQWKAEEPPGIPPREAAWRRGRSA